MGRIEVTIKLTNRNDEILYQAKARKQKPRHLEVAAVVDTGATRLYLQAGVIRALGLQELGTVRSRTTNGECLRRRYGTVHLELMGREENFDVIEVPDSVPNLLGQVPLEVLDFVASPKAQKLIPNPAHGGEQMTEEY